MKALTSKLARCGRMHLTAPSGITGSWAQTLTFPRHLEDTRAPILPGTFSFTPSDSSPIVVPLVSHQELAIERVCNFCRIDRSSALHLFPLGVCQALAQEVTADGRKCRCRL